MIHILNFSEKTRENAWKVEQAEWLRQKRLPTCHEKIKALFSETKTGGSTERHGVGGLGLTEPDDARRKRKAWIGGRVIDMVDHPTNRVGR